MIRSTLIAGAAVLLWSVAAMAQDGPNVNLPGIKEPDTTDGSCSHGGRNYGAGTVICKDDGFQYKCSDGGWENRGECPPEDTAPNGASVRAQRAFQPPPPDQPLAPEEMQPAEP